MKDYIEAMSFEGKLDKLQRGIEIPPPERVYRNLDFFKVWEIALAYMGRGEFQRGDKSAYNWALRHNVLNEICGHMPTLRKPRDSHARS